ncbi:MAG: hypothetical protein Q8R57_15040 [Bacteroidota bacterium]|nr:hypothetical protein [Bacteroidota bacterium]
MKPYLVSFLLILLFGKFSQSQTIQLVLSPKPSPYVSDWTSKRETAQIMVSNPTSNTIDAKVKTQLFLNGSTLYAETKTNAMPIISINPGMSVYGSDEIYPATAIQFQGTNMNSVLQTGKISDGVYTLCVQLVHPVTGLALTSQPPVCKVFTIVSYQAPILLYPANNASLNENMARNVLFKWTGISPNPNEPVSYRLKVFEVLDGQADIQAIRNNIPIVEKDLLNQTQSIWPHEFMPPEKDKNYVWTVVALDATEINFIDGDGFAQPFILKVRQPQMMGMTPPPNNNSSTNSGPIAVGDTIKAGQNGEFKIAITQVSVANNGNLTGKGKVWIPWIKSHFLVGFENIKVDSNRTLTKGGIIVEKNTSISNNIATYPQAWAQSLVAGNSWINNMIDGATNYTNNQINSISNWVDNNSGLPPFNYEANVSAPVISGNGLKLPLGLVFSGGNHKFLITEMLFKPNESKLIFLVQTEWMDNGVVKKLGFKGSGFIFKPNKVLFNNGRIELVENIGFLNSNQKIEYTFKKGTSTNGCYLQWADTGLVSVNLDMEVQFTRDWLIPIPSSNGTQRTKATLVGNGTSMQDIIITGNLGACEFVKVKGFKIKQPVAIALDFSDIRNTTLMQFPKNYPGDTGVDWRGFYIPIAAITIPEAWTKNTLPIPVNLSHLIIDNMGLSMKAKANNVVNLSQGSVNNMNASLDSIEIAIVNNSLQYGKAKGFLVIPICKDSLINRMKYTATFNQNNADSGLEFVLVPTQAIYTELLKGEITLKPSSSLSTTFKQGNMTISLKLDGTFKWNDPKLMATQNQLISGLPAPVRNLGIKGIKMEMEFEKLKLAYINNMSSNIHTATFDIGTWSFASPQKRAFNLPVTIANIQYKTLSVQNLPAPNKELFRGAITMDIIANLTDDIGGATKIGLAFALQTNLTSKKFKPEYKCSFVDSLQVRMDVAAVKFDGYLKIYDNDLIFGDGFKAEIKVKFVPISVTSNALVQFGNTAYQNANTLYRYWRVEANATFNPGLPFIAGIGFYGLGGGAYYNMKPISALVAGKSTISFQPQKGTSGFNLKATIGTYPKVETFNMDADINGTFTQGNGLVKITFNGDFYVAASIPKRSTAKIKGNVIVDYDFTVKEFNLFANVHVNAPPITTPAPANLSLNIKGKENLWYFNFGRPSQTNTVIINNFNVYEYLMFGNNLTDLPNGFTSGFKSLYQEKVGSAPTYSGASQGGVDDNTKTGKGMALGVGVKFDDQINKHIYTGTCRKWSVQSNLAAGAELHLSFLEYASCGSINPFGINGYRVAGGIGMYARANASVKGTPKNNHNGCDTKNYPIADFKTGLWLQGVFPNPTYLAGRLEGDVELLGNDNLSKRFEWDFQFGNFCQGAPAPGVIIPDQDKAGDYQNALIQYVEPSINTNFPITAPLVVKYGLEPNKVFDIGEGKADGTVKTRTFRMIVNTVKLEVKNTNGVYSQLTIVNKKNLIGEFQYTVKPPINVNGLQTLGNNIGSASNLATNSNTGNVTAAPNNFQGQMVNFSIPNPTVTAVPYNSQGLMVNFSIQNPNEPVVPNYPNTQTLPTNYLENKKSYRFTVTVTLQEYNPNNYTWQTALTKNGTPVTQTKIKLFSTPNPISFSTGPHSNK